jgi:hypothetical protein
MSSLSSGFAEGFRNGSGFLIYFIAVLAPAEESPFCLVSRA